MQPEKKFRDTKIIPLLKALPHTYYFIKQAHSVRGIPDICGCMNGLFFALELKASIRSEKQPLQQKNIDDINDSGGAASFVFPENAATFLTYLVDRAFSGGARLTARLLVQQYFPNF